MTSSRLLVCLLLGAAVVFGQHAAAGHSRVSLASRARGTLAFATPVSIDPSLIGPTLFVNPTANGASDSNPGTADLPLNTIRKAVQLAAIVNRLGTGVQVSIAAGVYREPVVLDADSASTAAPIVIQADGSGPVIIDGSDLWTGWQPYNDTVFMHIWPYRWGLAAYPPGWAGQVTLADIVRRREMIFAGGQALRQVLRLSDLDDNTFFVEEGAKLVYVQLSHGLTADQATIEVATRPALLTINGRNNVALRGLTFQRGNAAVQDGAVRIAGSQNVLIDGCSFVWNNWIGLALSSMTNVTIRNSTANFNGGTGVDGYQLKNLYFDRNDTSSNNWRGGQAGFFGWSVAGAKFTSVHDGKFRGHTSRGNQARGLWLDFDNQDILIDGSSYEGNQNDGLFLEANHGPIAIHNSSFRNNRSGSGILGANSSDVTIQNCVLASNSVAQISISGDVSRTVTDFVSGVSVDVRAERWEVDNSQLIGDDASQLLLSTPRWTPFLSSYQGNGNVWTNPASPLVILVGNQMVTFPQWQQLVSSDSDSTFGQSAISRRARK